MITHKQYTTLRRNINKKQQKHTETKIPHENKLITIKNNFSEIFYGKISKKKRVCRFIQWTYKNTNIYLKIFENKQTEYNGIISIINFCIDCFRLWGHTRGTINIYMYMNTIKKRKGILPEDINTGYTIDNEYIVIYRKEEMIKVLIHEMIHLYKMHPFDRKKPYIDIDSPNYALYEAYTETLATVMYYVYKTNDYEEFKKIYERQIEYGLRQGWVLRNTHEKTNVLCYVIIKTQILKYLNIMDITPLTDKKYEWMDERLRESWEEFKKQIRDIDRRKGFTFLVDI